MKVAVVIPCFKSKDSLPGVVSGIGKEVDRVYVVDDACPEGTVAAFMETNKDPRVVSVMLTENQGVGGATMAGYRAALADGYDIMVKVDSDGQMDPRLIPQLIKPIISHHADYTKGNRFFSIEDAAQMPKTRFLGNFFLSFISKASSGYWNVFDPTNGFTAIHRNALSLLPLDKIERRYFFESDLLFRLNTIEAVVQDAPMKARYGDEVSNLHAGRELVRFAGKHVSRLWKRIVYRYFLRGMSAGSVFLLGAIAFTLTTIIYAAIYLSHSMATGEPSSPGEVMLGGAFLIIAVQLALGFFVVDVSFSPSVPLQSRTVAMLFDANDLVESEPEPLAGHHASAAKSGTDS